ncbi:MAG: hypothetical protein M0Z62_14940 [Actinomycetota bacterium]|nr:hypothetical protein [Actinomycetota bacterium]
MAAGRADAAPGGEGSGGGSGGGPGARPSLRGYLAMAAVLVVSVGLEAAVFLFIRSKGVAITGDEPHYLIAARALTHFSPQVTWAYALDLHTHTFYNWPAGATLQTPGLMHAFTGPHGTVSAHGLGIPLLIMPFLAAAGKHGALLGYFAIQSAGLIYLHQRVSRLTGLKRGGQFVFALALAGPAVWIAGTQIYPDLPTGIFTAIAFVEVATVERSGSIPKLSAWVFALSMGFLPWMHVKNFLPGALACVAFTVAALRASRSWRTWRTLLVVGAVVAASWGLLFGYDLYYFGHLLGLPQPPVTVTKTGLAQALALVFDRQQGLAVQVPTTILGLAGMWIARRRIPVAAIGTLVAGAAVMTVNGLYISDPFGGDSLNGRFEWTVVPMLLAFAPFALAGIERSRARIVGVGTAIAGAWAFQAVPILAGDHSYYNGFFPAAPWDPSLYTGWWWHLDRIIPQFTARSIRAQPPFGLPLEIVAILALAVAVVRLANPRPLQPRRVTSLALGAVAATAVVTTVTSGALPTHALSWSGAALGGTLAATSTAADSPQVDLQGVGTGTFTSTLTYSMTGSRPTGSYVVSCTSQPVQGVSHVEKSTGRPLAESRTSVTTTIGCPAGVIAVQLVAGPGTTITPTSLNLQKISD